MKKRLEAELISIAHRILKLKNKSEVDQLYKETQKLYETLAVLKFYQDNFESVKSEVEEEVLEEKLEQFGKATAVPQPEVKEDIVEAVADAEPEEEETKETEPEAAPEEVVQPEAEEEVAAALTEEDMVSEEPEEENEEALDEEPELEEKEEAVVEDKPAFQPIFELEADDEEEEEEIVAADSSDSEQAKQTSFETQPEEKLEDHIGKYADPVFVKPDEVSLFPSDKEEKIEEKEEPKKEAETSEAKPAATNDTHSKTIAIGLNDRIGFVQHLFNDSNEDFNRVISQLNTFDTFAEAKNFINEMVIPDYGYWVGEEDYMERFMAIVEQKFQ
ncbi:hypothetical protein [Flavobacterium wongokense]|uniref:hypothetical protein n=1 Tax=Flavobacterium wongokense TaxID=2910674 RepID=UPI001F2B11A1|nr:hypothetical protein [Flavobacterium sp. WG47]MCF6131263.1 hypothetical protein [Flavobacterium sp. WG47]